MPLFRTKLDPRYVPLDPVEIDWTHTLAASLSFLWTSRGDLIRSPAFTVSSVAAVVSSVGPAVNLTTSSGFVNFASYSPITTSDGAGGGDFTMASGLYLPSALSGANYFLSQRKTANQTNFVCGRNYANTNVAGCVSFQLYSGVFTGASTATGATDGLYHVWAGVRSGVACKVYKDGSDVTSTSADSSSTVYATGQDFCVGNLAQGTSGSGIGGHTAPGSYLPIAATWNRALSQGELEWFTQEPFGMVQPIRRFFAVAPGSTPTDLTGVHGTGAIGAFAKSVSPHLTGTVGTGGVGGVHQGMDATGVHGTGAIGAFAKSVSPHLTGTSGTGAVGSFPRLRRLTGVRAFPEAGAISETGGVPPITNIELARVLGTGAAGAIIAVRSANPVLPKVAGRGAVGRLAAIRSNPVTGTHATGAVGALLPVGVPHGVALSDLNVSTAPIASGDFMVSLSWSDDRGESFGNPVQRSIGQEGEYITNAMWRRLGMGRDRIFAISWDCPTATSLGGAFIETDMAKT